MLAEKAQRLKRYATPADLRTLVKLAPLHPRQQEIHDSPALYKVVACGRQAGKTHLGAHEATEGLNAQERVLLSSTSQDQSDIFWEYITDWLADAIQSGVVYKHEGRRILRYKDGYVRVKTGRDPDVLRGGNWNKIIFDECAWLDPDTWYKVGQPMLLKSDGKAIFLSSPKRRNWFWELFVKAQADESGLWQAWNFSSHENPHLSTTALERMAENMSDEDYRQEILAEFLETAGAVFRRVDECATLQRREPYAGRFVGGLDFAQVKDYTVFMVMDADTRQLVDYDRFHKMDWQLQRGRIQTMYSKWQPQAIIAESNSVGSPNIEALQREGLPIVAFETTASSKPPLIESLVLAFDRDEIAILDDPILKNELKAFERKVSLTTGRSQYSAPDGVHDDTVMALALAWHGVIAGSRVQSDVW